MHYNCNFDDGYDDTGELFICSTGDTEDDPIPITAMKLPIFRNIQMRGT